MWMKWNEALFKSGLDSVFYKKYNQVIQEDKETKLMVLHIIGYTCFEILGEFSNWVLL